MHISFTRGFRRLIDELVAAASPEESVGDDGTTFTWWQADDAAPRSPHMPLCGIQNPGCICYANATLQMLFHLKPFREIVLHLETS